MKAILITPKRCTPVIIEGVRIFADTGSSWLCRRVAQSGPLVRAEVLDGSVLFGHASDLDIVESEQPIKGADERN